MKRSKDGCQTETIDKITVVLNPWLINDAMLKRKHIDPYNRLTLHRFGNMVSLAVHWEWIEQSLSVQENIALALCELIKKEYIICPYNDYTLTFVIGHLHLFVFYVQQIELAFDFRKDDIAIQGDAVKNGDLVQFWDRETNAHTENYYTPDYHYGKRKSVGIIYDKERKDRHGKKKR